MGINVYACYRIAADGRNLNQESVPSIGPSDVTGAYQNGRRTGGSRGNDGARGREATVLRHQCRNGDGAPCWRHIANWTVLCPDDLDDRPVSRAKPNPPIAAGRYRSEDHR